jgi:phage gp36-like protein
VPYGPSSQSTQYAQPADLLKYGMNQQVLSAPAISDPAVQNAQLLAASQVADSYLRQQFQLPLNQWGSELVKYVCWLASYGLICVRGYRPDAPGDQVFKENDDAARAWLRDVARGLATPDVTDSSPAAQPGVNAPGSQPRVVSAAPVNSSGGRTRGTGCR